MRTKKSSTDQKTHSFIETARRTQIIECAIETIATLGFAHASLAQIAKRAEISKGVISYYFTDKNELIEQVVTEIYGTGASFMTPHIEAAMPAGEQAVLRAYIQSNLAFMQAYPQYMLALVEIFTSFRTAEGKPYYSPADAEPILAPLKEVFIAGQQTGEFREFDPNVMAITLRAAIDAVPTQMAFNPELDLDAYAEELVTLFDQATRKGR